MTRCPCSSDRSRRPRCSRRPASPRQTSIPEIAFDSAPDFLKMPADVYLGEVAGVATQLARSPVRLHADREPDRRLGQLAAVHAMAARGCSSSTRTAHSCVRSAQGMYALLVAQAVRVDAQDNIWIVDEGSSQVVKFGPDGRVLMVMGRKPEAITIRPASRRGHRARPRARRPVRAPAVTAISSAGRADVAWDADGNIFVADGHGSNSRIAKFDRNGRFLSRGARGARSPGSSTRPHSIAVDAQGNVYVADQGNKRIQVFDNDGASKSQITASACRRRCASRADRTSISTARTPATCTGWTMRRSTSWSWMDAFVGKFGAAGKQMKEFGLVNALDCRARTRSSVGELANWRVQKLTLHAAAAR